MINLTKGLKPLILQNHANQWTNEALIFFNAGNRIPDAIINKYNHPNVKKALIEETNGKCAYCESFILDVDYGDIEHIIPKRKNPLTAFEWDNLTLSCSVCNNNKGDYFEQPTLLLNPYVDNINKHLKVFATLVMHVNGSTKGEFTHKLLKLNRAPLPEKRREAIDSFQNLIDKYYRENHLLLKDILKDEILSMIQPEKEHSLTLKCYAIAQELDFIF
ncbi:HNH endonuclease [Hymenobacter amundsenii]|uniref:HNH endonuclease n=1 Tax=Hymenobacter amundsenii TaxID=2006685 RepID=A0A246FJG1_9BACT|nr:HNH endonuclease [Hymenobacter amundsenii]OWP62688.1 HNH endonuclease [Hymenobacter amundsenii]